MSFATPSTILFPGTFDPPTLGHLDLVRRGATLFDRLTIAIGQNSSKQKAAFNVEERIELFKVITQSLPNVEVVAFKGLLVDLAKKMDVMTILRGLRNSADFDKETLQAEMNWRLEGVETLYLVAREPYRFISSTLIREIASHGRRLLAFVPSEIEEQVFQRLSKASQ